jgi:DNA-binding transcriptional ArsR family regulator
VAIRLTFTDDDPAAIRVGLSPLVEAVLSMHVLLYPKVHAAQHPWIREMRRLPSGLRRELQAFRFLLDDAAPDCVLPPRLDAKVSFDVHLDAIARLDPGLLAYDLARPLFHWTGPAMGGAEAMESAEVRERALARAASFGDGCLEVAALAWDDPAALRERWVALLASYWDAAWRAEWERLEPLLVATAEDARREAAASGPFALAARQPELDVEPAARTVVRRSPHEHTVEVSAGRPVMLVPSAYVWPHVRVNCDGPWPVALVFPAPFSVRRPADDPPPDGLVRALRAAADPVRLRVLRLVAERPRTTEELAPLVGLSESGLSKHLRALLDGELVRTRRDGRYVLYELGDGADGLASSLRAYLATDAQ